MSKPVHLAAVKTGRAGVQPNEAQSRPGRPKGLSVLFLTEVWERFSFYGLQALLFLYVTKRLGLADGRAFEVIGAFVSLVFMLPVIGGWVADRWIGARKAIIAGGTLLALGHLTLAIEPVGSNAMSLQWLYGGLSLIAAGVGLLKSNISTLVGRLYDRDDPAREAAFSVFYVGINVGVLLGPLVCGYLGETYGWSYGFGAAGVGMLVGLAVFVGGSRHLPPDPIAASRRGWAQLSAAAAAPIMAVTADLLFQAYTVLGIGLGVCAVALVVGVAVYSVRNCSRAEQLNHLLAFFLIGLATVYWSLFVQAGSSLTALIDRLTDRNVFGVEIKASQFQSLNALFIIGLAPVLSWVWLRLARSEREPGVVSKMALALMLGGLSFALLATGLLQLAPGARLNVVWVVGAYFLMTLGELCLSPVGLSAISRLASPGVAGVMMGAWFLSTAGAGYLGAFIAKLTIPAEAAQRALGPAAAVAAYRETFFWLFVVAAAVGAATLAGAALTKTRASAQRAAEARR